MLYALIAVAYSVIIPFGEPTDEPAHYAYIWYLLTYRKLPVQSPDPLANLVNEGHHPPAYYALVAALTGWAPYAHYEPPDNPYLPSDVDNPEFVQRYLHTTEENFPWRGPVLAAHIARLVSIGMGMASVWVTYRVVRHIAPETPRLALFAAGIHAFNPMFVHVSSAISNDNAAILIGSLMIWQMLRILRRPSATKFVVLGTLTGLGILSKVNLIALLPAVAWTGWRASGQSAGQPTTWTKRLQRTTIYGLLVLLPVLIVSGWWLWRNVQLYGDPFAWNIRMVTHHAQRRQTQITALYVLDLLWRQFRSFWGLFGWIRITLAPWIYWLLFGFTVAGFAGMIKEALKHRATLLARNYDLYALLIGFTLLATWSQASNRDSTVAGQGRFLFPVLSIIVYLLAQGSTTWLHRHYRHRAQQIVISALFVLSASVLLFRLIPIYARPLRAALPSQAQAVQATFEPWELTGWYTSKPVAGEEMTITLYWRAARQLDTVEQETPVFSFVHLVNGNGEALAKWNGVPTGGRFPPQAWSTDSTTAHTVKFQLPETEALSEPQLAYLYVGFFYLEGDEIRRIPVDTSQQTRDGTLILGPMIVRPTQTKQTKPEKPLDITFSTPASGQIELLGYDLQPENGKWHVTLHWRAATTIAQDYTVFVHLIDDNAILSQGDGPPCNGQCPTSLWRTGDTWQDTHSVPVPESTTTTQAPTLAVGWYDPQTGTRLPAFSKDGQRLNQDRLRLCIFSEAFSACQPTN